MNKVLFSLTFVFSTMMAIAEPPVKGVHSVADFEKLYKDKVFPFDKISDTTFQRLKSGIAFDDMMRFRGFLFIGGLRKELTFDEYQRFNELIIGEKTEYTEEDRLEYEIRRNRK